MTQPYEKWGDVAKKLQEPIQAITELNITTLQSMSYLKPDDLLKVKKPEDLMEQQMELAIKNGHKVLDYWQNCFQITEKAMLSVFSEAKKTTEKMTETFKKQ